MNYIKVFKFRSVNDYLFASLARSEIYFANPEALNDPYDCQVDLAQALARAIELTSGAQRTALESADQRQPILQEISKQLRTFGVCSFSLSPMNQLLWSHYANKHCGVCILYTIPESYVRDEDNGIFGMSAVDYGDSPLTSFFLNYDFSGGDAHFSALAQEAIKKALTVKSSDWCYEQEVRMIRQQSSTMAVPSEFLTNICFGLRTPVPERTKIRQLVEATYEGVIFTELRHGKSDFGLEIHQI